jgi:membrane protein implicated in regulation of membrane protease activity
VSIKIKLTEGQVLRVRADPEDWARAFRNALDTNSVIEVHGSDGRTLAINPHQILFWEEIPDAAPVRLAQTA